MALLKRKRTGLSDPMSVVTSFVNACNRHDAEGVSACLHPDFDSIQPMYPSRNFRGADQVRRNWQAIFDAEPGFRLTVLRSAAIGDTVWLELHGAGRDAEVAGVFVMGIEGDRIRWARIYSALVEGAPAAVQSTPEQPTPLREVPPLRDEAARDQGSSRPSPATGANLEEDLIAPVVDIDGNGRSRRRRFRRQGRHDPAPDDVGGDRRTAEADPAVEEAAAALASVPTSAKDHGSEAPSDTPADSIDPENLVDARRPVHTGSVEPDVVAEPRGRADAGSDYDLEITTTVEAVGAERGAERRPETSVEPDPERGSDVMVETMVAFVPDAAVGPDPLPDPEPEFLVERVVVEAPAEPQPGVGEEAVTGSPPGEGPLVADTPPADESTRPKPQTH